MGSSPRGRGKPERVSKTAHILRLIPAWAGKTRRPPARTSGCRAHPRVGGENLSTTVIPGVANGSSPRGRGKLRAEANNDTNAGLIPAWAGKTASGLHVAGEGRAHPRVGGENFGSVLSGGLGRGSSPRGRGKREATTSVSAGMWLIPAWAGKTEGVRPWFHGR